MELLTLPDGRKTRMASAPLEDFWEANPPRPYLTSPYSGHCKPYDGKWEISDGGLYLVAFEGVARRTSSDWIGDEMLDGLWGVAKAPRFGDGTVQRAIEKLSDLPVTTSAAAKRAARIVLALSRQLISTGGLTPSDPAGDLYRAAVDASWKCCTDEEFPVTLETLFPGSNGRVPAAWYSGALQIPEGKLLGLVDPLHGFGAVYEFTRLIEVREGRVIAERLRKNDPPPPPRDVW